MSNGFWSCEAGQGWNALNRPKTANRNSGCVGVGQRFAKEEGGAASFLAFLSILTTLFCVPELC